MSPDDKILYAKCHLHGLGVEIYSIQVYFDQVPVEAIAIICQLVPSIEEISIPAKAGSVITWVSMPGPIQSVRTQSVPL